MTYGDYLWRIAGTICLLAFVSIVIAWAKFTLTLFRTRIERMDLQRRRRDVDKGWGE